MRVVVCGGRDFDNAAFLFLEMDKLHRERPIRELMQGGNKGARGKRGADQLARDWALTKPEIVRWTCRAEWTKYGDAAGPIRNGRMVLWRPDVVVSFPGGTGTANMVMQARAANIEVIEIGV